MPGASTPLNLDSLVPVTIRIVSRKANLTTFEARFGPPKLHLPLHDPMERTKAAVEKIFLELGGRATVDELGNLRPRSKEAMGVRTQGLPQCPPPLIFPSKPVQLKDTWSTQVATKQLFSDMDMPDISVKGTIPVVYRLVGLETRSGKTFARITMSLKGRGIATSLGSKLDLIVDSFSNSLIDVETGQYDTCTSTIKTSLVTNGKALRQRMVTTLKLK